MEGELVAIFFTSETMADRISVWLIIKVLCAQDLVLAGYLKGRYLQKGLSFYYQSLLCYSRPAFGSLKTRSKLLS